MALQVRVGSPAARARLLRALPMLCRAACRCVAQKFPRVSTDISLFMVPGNMKVGTLDSLMVRCCVAAAGSVRDIKSAWLLHRWCLARVLCTGTRASWTLATC